MSMDRERRYPPTPRPLDTSELGPVKLDTAPRVLRMQHSLSRGWHVQSSSLPDHFDVIEWGGVRFVKEQG